MWGKDKQLLSITKRDLILGTVIAILVSIPFLFTPKLAGRYVSDREIEGFILRIDQLPVSKIADDIETANGKPTLMLIYASWCSYCKFLLPSIATLKEEGKLEDVNLYFISIDKDRRELAGYLLRHDYNKLFTPQMLNRTGEQTLTDLLISKGSNFNGSIPYGIIFDGNGKLVAEIPGLVNKRTILEKINYVTNPPKED